MTWRCGCCGGRIRYNSARCSHCGEDIDWEKHYEELKEKIPIQRIDKFFKACSEAGGP